MNINFYMFECLRFIDIHIFKVLKNNIIKKCVSDQKPCNNI